MKRTEQRLEIVTYELNAEDVRAALKAYVESMPYDSVGHCGIVAAYAELQLCADGTATFTNRYPPVSQEPR